MSLLVPMSVANMTVSVAYSVNLATFNISSLIKNGQYPYVHSMTAPPSGFGSLAPDSILWDTYKYTKPAYHVGSFTSTLTVTDANSETATATITFVLEALPQPVYAIVGGTVIYPSVGKSFTETYSLTGGAALPYSWSLVSGTLPDGLSFSQDGDLGKIHGVATEIGAAWVRLSVTDSSDPAITKAKDVNIISSVSLELQAPAIPDPWYLTQSYEFIFTALVDASLAGSLVWGATGLPGGILFNVLSGGLTARLAGTPTVVGTYSPTITVSSPISGDSSFVDLPFSVVASAGALSASNDVVTTNYNTPVTIDVLANDSGLNASIIGLSNPSSGTAVVSSGKVVYTPNSQFSGVDSFVYTLSDGSTTAQGTVTVTVGQPGLADAPLITNAPSSDITVQQGDAYSLTLTATGGVPPYRWGISSSSSANTWLTVNPTTGALSGTFSNPTAVPGYTNTFLVTVTDTAIPPKSDTATLSFVLGVSPYTATIEGTLRLDTSSGAFAARKVYLYNYTTGVKVAETTSDGVTGVWSFTAVAPGEYFVVGVAQGDDLNIPRDFDAMGVITVV